MTNQHDVLTLKEAAEFIRVSEKTLGDLARSRRIPGQKVGREWRFLRGALEEWLRGVASPDAVAEPVATHRQRVLFGQEEGPVDRAPGPAASFGDTAFTKNRREPMHRWVPWIAGFSAAFVEEVLRSVVSSPAQEITVLDPFAGVGTTLLEALMRGYHAVGFEINPYAALACRVKLESRHCDLAQLESAIKDLSASLRRRIPSPKTEPKSRPPPGFRTKRPFFSPAVQRQALFLRDFISEQDDGLVRDIIRVAFGSVMVSFSNYSYEPSLGTRAAAGKSDILEADVARTVTDKLWEMHADIEFLQRHLSRLAHQPTCTVYERSYLTASDVLPEASADVLITSPPYLNNYHYIRNTRPQLYWLDLVQDRSELKSTENESFGQFWQTVRAGPRVELDADDPELHALLERVRSRNPEKGVYGGAGWANYAATYLNDCGRFCRVVHRHMKPGGHVVVVIGNNILQGIEVRMDEIFAQIARRNGFQLRGMHRVRKKRTGSSIVDSSVRAGTARKRTELYETAVHMTASP